MESQESQGLPTVNPAENGAFLSSLRRNNKQIKDARALSIFEDVEMSYKRGIEDMEKKLKRLERNLEDMLDMSPEVIGSLKPARDIDPVKFVEEDGAIADQIYNLEKQLNIRKKRYNFLFSTIYTVKENV